MGLEIGITKLSMEDRVGFFKTLSGWLNSGAGRMPVAEAVANTCDAYSREEYKALRGPMGIIIADVQSGQTPFYEALANADIGFEDNEIAIIRAAEQSNQLRQAVPSLANALSVQFSGRRQLIAQMSMPLIVGFMLIALSVGVLTIMLPMVIEPVLKRRPEALADFPALVRYYWYASVWLRANYVLTIGVLSLPIVIFLFRKMPFIAGYLEHIKMHWKPTRRLTIAFNSLLTVYFFPALLRSGMPAYKALQELATCVPNATISKLIEVSAQEHESGVRLSESMTNLPYRASFVNALTAGEASGEIPARLDELQEPYKIELERQIKMIVSKLKFLVMAILLPFFIVSTYTSLVGPIFALMEY